MWRRMLCAVAGDVRHCALGFAPAEIAVGARPRGQEAAFLFRRRQADHLWLRIEGVASGGQLAARDRSRSLVRLFLLRLHPCTENDLQSRAEAAAGTLSGGLGGRTAGDRLLGHLVRTSRKS